MQPCAGRLAGKDERAAVRRPPLACQLEFTALREGQGLARLNGDRVEVAGAVPGDLARCLAGKRRRGQRPGWLVQVERPGPGRVEPRCAHFGACGGCSLQHLDYAAGLEAKAGRVAELVRRAVSADPEVLPPVASPRQWFYRSKVEFSFSREWGLGFNRKGRFHQVVEVDRCWIGPPSNRAALEEARSWASRHDLRGWDPRALEGDLRYLVLRHSFTTGEWLACVITSPERPDPAQARELALRLVERGASGVVWGRQASTGSAVKPEEAELLAGSDRLRERLGPLEFELTWRSFFQSNPPAYYELLEEARRWTRLDPGCSLLDLYCGIGTVGLFLAPEGAALTGVESVPEAVDNARANALRNGRSAEFHRGTAEEWPGLLADLVVLDPPRGGCHPRLLERLVRQGPARLLYISCNPERLALEVHQLAGAYRLERLRCFDFFPHTRHLEALCLLSRVDPGTG